MAYFEDNSTPMLLEQMIDAVGTRNVAWAVARICALKAAHVEETWQDGNAAKSWDRSQAAWERFAANCPTSPLDGGQS